jgi:hypothetical protein
MSEVLKSALDKWKNNVTEAKEIVRTAELVINHKIYRLEVIKVHGTGQFKGQEMYEVYGWCYTEQSGERVLASIQPGIPWINAPTAEFALDRAINWLVTGDI